MYINPQEIFFKNKRFDLIFKILYLKNKIKYNINIDFFENLYLEHIKVFNNFHEENPSDGNPKNGKESFLLSFDKIFISIRENGFLKDFSQVYIDDTNEIYDGSHRFAICFVLNIPVYVFYCKTEQYYDYNFFLSKGLKKVFSDYAAFEYLKINPFSFVVNIHSIVDLKFDANIENILNKFGFVYYKKTIKLSFNGYVNLKKESYRIEDGDYPSWIGSYEDDFLGAQNHAKKSFGKNPLRVYVFVCDSYSSVRIAKQEIRDLLSIGNYSVHITDSQKQSVELGQLLFNDNSIMILEKRSFKYHDRVIENYIKEIKNICNANSYDLNLVCGAGSTPLGVIGLRNIRDFDYLSIEKLLFLDDVSISNHDSELSYYPVNKFELIFNPEYHFYHNGFKFITLSVLLQMKNSRMEIPKDKNDLKLIKRVTNSNFFSINIKSLKIYIILYRIVKRTLKWLKKKNKQKIAIKRESTPESLKNIWIDSASSFIHEFKRSEIFLNINEESICIDCGANIGDVTELFVSRGALVYSFEPQSLCYKHLSNRFKNNQKVVLFKKGVYSENCTKKLYNFKFYSSDKLIFSQGSSIYSTNSEIDINSYETIDLIDITDFIKSIDSVIYILKLDIEGAEFDVLEKIIDLELYKKITHIIVETHEDVVPELMDKASRIKKLINKKNINNINFNWV